jgi:hypothetical protein
MCVGKESANYSISKLMCWNYNQTMCGWVLKLKNMSQGVRRHQRLRKRSNII